MSPVTRVPSTVPPGAAAVPAALDAGAACCPADPAKPHCRLACRRDTPAIEARPPGPAATPQHA